MLNEEKNRKSPYENKDNRMILSESALKNYSNIALNIMKKEIKVINTFYIIIISVFDL